MSSSPDRLITVAQLCERLGWSEQKVRRLVDAREIPHHRIRGKWIHFRESEIEAWLSDTSVPMAAEEAQRADAVIDQATECRRLGIPTDHHYS